jgi:molybdate transport system substrate-binding protein
MARLLVAVATALAWAGPSGAAGPSPPPPVIVFAAASLQTAIDAMVPAIDRAAGVDLRVSYAASSALARQIDNGAPADLFISADLEWMDYLEARSLLRPETRTNLLGNRLVLIAPAGSHPVVDLARPGTLAAALGSGRLAAADPDAVPAGKYAKAALTDLGMWPSLAPKIAAAENVRAALLLVSRGEAPLGIVYRSDAIADRGVRIVAAFPEHSHPRIIYPAALTKGAAAGAQAVLAYLGSDAARQVFASQGFVVLR